MKVKARVQLSNLLDEIMPGIQNIIPISSRYLENTLFFDFVEKYQSYEKISQMGEKRFVNSYIAFAQNTDVGVLKRKLLRFIKPPLMALSPAAPMLPLLLRYLSAC